MEVSRVHMNQVIFSMLDEVKDFPVETGSRVTVLRNMIQVIADTHNQEPGLHREIEAMKYSSPDIHAFDKELNVHFDKRFTGFWEQFRGQLRIADLEAATPVISCAVQASIHAARPFNSPIGDARLIDAVTDIIYRYLFK